MLDIIGLNIYFDHDIACLLGTAWNLFPVKKIAVAETATIYCPDCYPPALWWAKLEALNESGTGSKVESRVQQADPRTGETMNGNLLSEDGTYHRQNPSALANYPALKAFVVSAVEARKRFCAR